MTDLRTRLFTHDGLTTRSSGVRLRHAARLLLAFIGLFTVVALPGGVGLAHAQEPTITVRFEKEFHQYSESVRNGRLILEARTAGNVAPTEDFTVTVVTEDANTEAPLAPSLLSAVAGIDFRAFSRTYTFRASDFVLDNGQYVNTMLVALEIIVDDIVEKIESFGVVIQSTGFPPHVSFHSPQYRQALVIINDDSGPVTMSASAPEEVTEGEGFDFIMTIDKEIQYPFTVVVSTVDGTATAASLDYRRFTTVLEFEASQRRFVQRVQTLADNLIEEDEQFEVWVVRNGLDRAVVLPETPTASITIKDSTAPTWEVSTTPAQLSTTALREDAGAWTLTVATGGVRWQTDQTITFDFAAPPTAGDGCTDAATPDEDFTITDDSGVNQREPDTLILKAGRTQVTGTFTIVNDMRNELTEAVLITPRYAGVPLSGPHTFTIIDDDTAAKLESAVVDGRTVTLTFDTPMTHVRPPSDPNHIDYEQNPNTPQQFFTLFEGNPKPTDNNLGSSSYREEYGTGARSFSISGRVVTLTFLEAVQTSTNAWIRYDRFSRYSLLGPATHTVRCGDGRAGPAVSSFITQLDGTGNTGGTVTLPELSVSDAQGREGANANIPFTVRLNPASTETVVVDYRTVARTATAGEDFTATSGTLTFAPGQTSKTVRVPIIDDTVEDDGETFLFYITDASGATYAGNNYATGTIRNTEAQPTGNENELTANFSSVPAEHGGPGEASRFTFDLSFSEEPTVGYKKLRDDAFTVSGGDVKKAKRKVRGSNQTWTITVEPDGWSNVNISLPGGRACTSHAAVCTDDGRMLSNTPSATVSGPGALAVADASAHENTDDALNFVVSLDRPSTLIVTVGYATSNATATAGADYTATSGTLTFNPGDVTKTVSVPILDDAVNDGQETITLTLSNAANARVADGTATGTIENSDPMPKAWAVRFGRSAASHVLDALEARLDTTPQSFARLGGHQLGGSADVKEAVERLAPDRSLWEEASADSASQNMTVKELLLGSAFHLVSNPGSSPGQAGEAATGPRLSAWGRVASSGFDGQEDRLSLNGTVTTATLGVDGHWKHWLTGVALAYSEGDGSFSQVEAAGDVDSSLTSVHPYVAYALSDRVRLWGMVGYGSGSLQLKLAEQGAMDTDLAMTMGALGIRGSLLEPSQPAGGLALALRSDVLWVRMDTAAVEGMVATEADVSRLRLVLEGSRPVALAAGGSLIPTLEVGLRHDGGDAETGSGLEVGGRLRYTSAWGLSIEASVRGLLAHEANDYREWGASGALRFDPGQEGRGLTASIVPTWGSAASGVSRLWGQPDASGLVVDNALATATAGRLDAELGYGLATLQGRGLLTPYVRAALVESDSQAWHVGARLALAASLNFSVEASRRQREGDVAAHELALLATLGW